MNAPIDAAPRQSWADVEDSSQELISGSTTRVSAAPELVEATSQSSPHSHPEPSQLFPNTPESVQEVSSQGSSHLAPQGSLRIAPEVFPSTPNSFDGSQQRTGLTQEFQSTVTIQSPSDGASMPGASMAAEGPGPQPAASQQSADVIAPQESTGGWSWHRLQKPALAMAGNSPKKKRGVQSPSKLSAQKRPRPNADAAEISENAVGSWAVSTNSASVGSVQRRCPSSGSSSNPHNQLRRRSGGSSLAANPNRSMSDSAHAGQTSSSPVQHNRPNSGTSSWQTSSTYNPRGSPSPEPVEGTVEQRRTHRQNGVDSVLRSADYLFLLALQNQGVSILLPGSPFGHRLEDVAAVNKRPWEKSMQDWRNEVHRLAEEHGHIHLGRQGADSVTH